ncbi:type II toxin-antitoxin system Phd/YefM family antitoxin [Mycolicibacter senuensis]|uniref:type II toxin-antitoxin system Phd/YefM family antitoxin n=1 Tax=Mycolicibacter senuensis TaxID=386913 RepID=UPI001057F5D2|nr:type II toxin-antitoxin system Phd/YefM family antitoxin [Mycolicibacter senuensis]
MTSAESARMTTSELADDLDAAIDHVAETGAQIVIVRDGKPVAALVALEDTAPYRDEILTLLRSADCHYGNALRDKEAGLSIAEAAAKRDEVTLDRIEDLRHAVHQVADAEPSRTKTEAGHEDGVLRALLHFESEMSPELRQHVYARLTAVQAEFGLRETTQPLRCVTRGAQARRR